MTGYLIRRDTPDEDRVLNGRLTHLSAGWSYLEYLPAYRRFAWLAMSQEHATVFDQESAEAQADVMRASEPASYTIRVVEDYRRRTPTITMDALRKSA